MVSSGFIKLINIVISIVWTILVYMNPLTYGNGDMSRIGMISGGLNEIFKALGIKITTAPNEMVSIIIFTEFAILGIFLMMATKVIFGDIRKNIFVPLFYGLLLAVIMGYNGSINNWLVGGIESVMNMFFGLVLGIAIYLLVSFVRSRFSQRKTNSKSKYKRRR